MSGAAGFLGANLVRRLIADGHEVSAILQPTTDTWRLDDIDDLRRIEGDMPTKRTSTVPSSWRERTGSST